MSKATRDRGSHGPHSLWSQPENVRELRRIAAIYLSLLRGGDRPLRTIVDAVRDRLDRPEGDDDPYQAIDRFLRFESKAPQDPRLLDALADAVFVGLDQQARPQISEAFDPAIDLRGRIRRHLSSDGADAKQNPDRLAEAQFALRFADSDSTAAAAYLLRKEDKAAYFACYRYSSTVGSIAKSSIVIEPPNEFRKYCRFENRFKNREGSTREAAGACFREGDWIYLVGQIENSLALKVLAIRAAGTRPASVLQGVLLSRGAGPLVARVVLRSIKEPLDDGELRIVSEKEDREFNSADFAKTIRPKIMNSVEFDLQDRLLYRRNRRETLKAVTQKYMVGEVGRLLDGKFFLNDRKHSFNPADHSHYPFNQAISASKE